ncbi:MAG: ferredoxin [Saprospiraceae bacterium]|jgi:ferredoxin|nr:ferredoxin [Saprospiraceae bacterium]MBP9209313.1 ferredoxin [Saprospiraceae bacterium]MBV6474279.1 hypothetical protein [Saprospiraceae bacterium]MCC6753653.1 ferredoxin [Saprospiraceae bacterium]
MKEFRVIQQRERCIGCGACQEAAPGRWAMSAKDGKSILIGGKEKRGYHQVTIDETELEENLAAARNCPVLIIRILQSVARDP